MVKIESDTLYGTLNLLILKTLAPGPMHGLEVARMIGNVSSDVLRIEEGALYPALHRLERDDLLEAQWGISDRGRRAKFYALTPQGRARLDAEVKRWVRHTRAVQQVLDVVLG